MYGLEGKGWGGVGGKEDAKVDTWTPQATRTCVEHTAQDKYSQTSNSCGWLQPLDGLHARLTLCLGGDIDMDF